jgi:hypothetical protein
MKVQRSICSITMQRYPYTQRQGQATPSWRSYSAPSLAQIRDTIVLTYGRLVQNKGWIYLGDFMSSIANIDGRHVGSNHQGC